MRDACGGRDNDKERAYGGPKVERQIFGIFLNCFVILFSFAGARGDLRGPAAARWPADSVAGSVAVSPSTLHTQGGRGRFGAPHQGSSPLWVKLLHSQRGGKVRGNGGGKERRRVHSLGRRPQRMTSVCDMYLEMPSVCDMYQRQSVCVLFLEICL